MSSSSSLSAPLALCLLGPLRIERNGIALTPPKYHRARALLAWLAVEDGWHTREFLADMLWPAASAATGRENLRRMLFLLKPLLADCQLQSTRNEVRLPRSAALVVDAVDFFAADTLDRDDLQGRFDRYQGHFLQGFSLNGAPAFEQWMEARRADAQARFVAAGVALAGLLADSGQMTEALARARRLLLLAPWAEAGWQCLIRLLLQAGRPDEARTELAQCCAVLRDELGIAPTPETMGLVTGAVATLGLPGLPVQTAERRQLTVLHCELAIPGEDDPEILADRLNDPLQRCNELLRAAGAHVSASPGGGLLAYFGFPVAREGDARRAVGAALACRALHDGGLQARIGLHSGLVLTQAAAGSPDVAGLVTGLAIRMREAAAPGEACLSESTRHMVAHACNTEVRGQIHDSMSGRAIDVFALLGTATGQARWGGDSPLVGRKRELEILMQARQAGAGSGRLVLLSGEAGSGKTRLLREFAATSAAQGSPAPLTFACLPEFQDKNFHPFLAQLPELLDPIESLAGLADAVPAALGLPAEAAAVIAGLTGRPGAADADIQTWPAGKWQQLAIAVLLALLDRATARGAAIFLEDLHWADHSTRALCAALDSALSGRLVVATARPSFAVPWDEAAATHIALAPLDRAAARTLAQSAAGTLDARALEQVVEMGAGIPLFIEEVAREMAVSCGVLPATLHDILQVRVDAAGVALPLLRLAASMGTAVQAEELALVARLAPDEVARTLDTLVETGLLAHLAPRTYQFRHVLLREAAYQSQSRATRAASHQAIIAALCGRDPQAPELFPELFAWHFTQAGQAAQAIDCLMTAGGRAAARSLYHEASAHYGAALDLVATLPPSTARNLREIELRLAAGIPLLALHGNGSREAGDMFRHTLALAEPMGDDPALFPVYWGLWLGSSSCEDFDASRIIGEKLVRLAGLGDASNRLAHAHYALGNSLFCLGQFGAATAELEAGVRAYRPGAGDFSLGEDALVTNLSFLSWAHWFNGRHEDARAASQRAVATARTLEHPYTLGFALVFSAILHRWRGEIDQAVTAASETLTLAERFGMALWQAAGTVILGWARVARGDPTGIDEVLGAVAILGQVMGGVETMFLAHLVDACQTAQRPDTGLAAAERGIAVAAQRKDWHYLAEFQRLRGEFLVLSNADAELVESCLREAESTARRLASPALILRAVSSRARLCIAAGHIREAEAMLNRALAAFHDGFDTGDLRAAQAMLDALPHTMQRLA